MIRKVEEQEEFPEVAKKDYFNDEPFLKEKLDKLKTIIKATFPVSYILNLIFLL